MSQVSSNNGKNLSIAALVCGILGIVGGLGRKRMGGKSGLATAGLVLGIVALALSVLGIICVVCALGSLAAMGAAA